MKLIKMSYKGFTFDVNPSSLKIEMSKSISVKQIPFGNSKAQEINFEPVKISGSGRIVGENAMEKAFELERIFKAKDSSYLFMPNSTPIVAFFSAFSISFDSNDNSVSYSFEFVEDNNNKKNEYPFEYTLALKNESLFDVANRTGVCIEKLFEANNYKNLFSLKAGDKVWLC